MYFECFLLEEAPCIQFFVLTTSTEYRLWILADSAATKQRPRIVFNLQQSNYQSIKTTSIFEIESKSISTTQCYHHR